MKHFFVIVLLSFIPCILLGQTDDPINTDRPDQSDGTSILMVHAFQIETGFDFGQKGNQLSDIAQSTMLRYGLFKKCEIRLIANEGFNSNDAFKTNSFGLYPLTVSSKFSLCEQNKVLPAITLVGYVKIPFLASTANQLNYYAPTFLIAFENDFAHRFNLNYNAGVSWDGIEKQQSYLATMSVSCALNKKFSVFGEYFSSFSKLDSPGHNMDMGAQYLIGPQLQIDIAAGTSLFNHTQSMFETMGLSYRFH